MCYYLVGRKLRENKDCSDVNATTNNCTTALYSPGQHKRIFTNKKNRKSNKKSCSYGQSVYPGEIIIIIIIIIIFRKWDVGYGLD
jgi:hypothetical protein